MDEVRGCDAAGFKAGLSAGGYGQSGVTRAQRRDLRLRSIELGGGRFYRGLRCSGQDAKSLRKGRFGGKLATIKGS